MKTKDDLETEIRDTLTNAEKFRHKVKVKRDHNYLTFDESAKLMKDYMKKGWHLETFWSQHDGTFLLSVSRWEELQ